MYEEPRRLLKLIPESRVLEMGRNRENALCCGTSAWMECSNCSKSMRVERLHEALGTGANTLITACPKCQVHFSCAQNEDSRKLDHPPEIEMIDLTVLAASRLTGSEG